MNNGRRNNAGRGGRGRGRGSSRRNQRIPAGRRLFRHEQDQIVCMFALLSTDSRRELVQLLQGLSGETPSVPIVPPAEPSEEVPVVDNSSRSPAKSPGRVKIFQREIIKDLPGVAEFAAMNSEERNKAKAVQQLMSAAAGVIARAKKHGLSDQEILEFITENCNDIHKLQHSYPKDKPQETEESSDDETVEKIRTDVLASLTQAQNTAIVVGANSASNQNESPSTGDHDMRTWAEQCDSEGEKSPENPKAKSNKRARTSSGSKSSTPKSGKNKSKSNSSEDNSDSLEGMRTRLGRLP